jgi:nucleoside 2-deoxyribosyltransferase
MTGSVYVAGSSHPDERDRVTGVVEALRAAGVTVTSTWLDDVAKHGAGNPRDMSVDDRRTLAAKDLAQVGRAQAFLLLVPSESTPTRGAWVELSYAYSMGKQVVCSGDTKQSIFSALGYETESDADAIRTVIAILVGQS